MDRRSRSSRALVLVACLVFHLLPPGPAGAEEKQEAGPDAEQDAAPRWSRRTPQQELAEDPKALKRVVGQRTGRILVKAREYLLEQKYDEAQEVIEKIRPRRSNAYERALAARIRAYIAYGRQQPAEAIRELRLALEEDILSRADSSDVLFQIAQIQNSQSMWADAVATLETWFATAEQPGSAAYVQLALAHYQLKPLDPALEAARSAVELAEVPQQGWLQLLLAIYLTQEEYAAATPVLVELLSRYPGVGKSYWLQLSTLYGVQQDIPRALAVLELAHRQGFLGDDRDLRRLAQLSQSQDMPVRAALVLEEGIAQQHVEADAEAYELLANSWMLARDAAKAEPPLLRAAELSRDGDLYVRLAQLRMLGENWDGASQALRSAMEKGGLDDAAKVELLLGITHYNADRLGEARNWFARARRATQVRAPAEAWIDHIDRELTQRAKPV